MVACLTWRQLMWCGQAPMQAETLALQPGGCCGGVWAGTTETDIGTVLSLCGSSLKDEGQPKHEHSSDAACFIRQCKIDAGEEGVGS